MPNSETLIRKIRNTSVMVIHPPDEDRSVLSLQLRRIGCEVNEIWPLGDAPQKEINALYFLADSDQRASLSWLSDWRHSALIAVVAYENPLVLQSIADIGVHGVVTKPIRPIGILANLFTALSVFKYEERLNARVAKLDETLKTRRLVERAMRILAQHQDISEDDAYALMRTEAMNKQVTIYEMATSILNADKIFLKDV